MSLTDRQKQYIWLMGSFPDKLAFQGRGYRSKRLMYGVREEELVIFGYSSPFIWLDNRGLTRPLANNPRARVLTEEGEMEFKRMLARGAGMKINPMIREVEIAPKPDTPA